MKIDIPTFSLILGITHLIQVMIFFYHQKVNRNIKGPVWWLWWSIAEAAGFVFVIIRQYPSLLPISILFQGPVILLGTVFIYIGVIRFFDKKVPFRLLILFFGSFCFLHLFFYLAFDLIQARSILFALYMALTSFSTAVILLKHLRPAFKMTAYFNFAIFIVHGSVYLYRFLFLAFSSGFHDILIPSFNNYLLFFDGLIASLLWTFGLIMMVNQKLKGEITEVKSHFELIFNSSPDAVAITGLNDGFLVDFNDSFSRISGYSKEELKSSSTIRKNIWAIPEQRDTMVSILREKYFCENYEALFRRKDGSVFIGQISSKLVNINEKPFILTVTRDISARVQFEEEIKQKNEELRKINAEKDKFFSILAHDLKSPFNGFLGLTEIMAAQMNAMTLPEIEKVVQALKTSAANLFRLLENLLEWSRMEQGMVPFKPEMLNLASVLNESLTISGESARSKNITIEILPNEISQVYADKNILLTIFRNLISNAIKFTHPGGKITISAEKPVSGILEFSIRDTGIGMNQQVEKNLFRLDAQVNRKGTEGELSTGLGLIICKDFVEKQGGIIRVESEEGKGSVFYFTIPGQPEQ